MRSFKVKDQRLILQDYVLHKLIGNMSAAVKMQRHKYDTNKTNVLARYSI